MYNRSFSILYLTLKDRNFLKTVSQSASLHSCLITKNQHVKSKIISESIPKIRYCFILNKNYSCAKPPFNSKPPGSTSSHVDDSFLPSDSEDETDIRYDEDANEEMVEEVKEKILSSALLFVNQYGWTKESLAKGAEKTGFSRMSHALIPHSGYDLISYHYKQANNQLVEYMKEESKNKTSTSAFLESCIKYRLSLNLPYIKTWHQAMIIMTQPCNLADSIKNNLQMIDDIWFYAGDRSLDHSWYSKRLVLAAVYKSTELYMIGRENTEYERDFEHREEDEREDSHSYQDVWEFLRRRILHAEIAGKCLKTASKAPEFMTSVLQVARNIMSVNNLNRKY